MTANLLFLVILTTSVAATLAIYAVCIRWGLKWAKIADISVARALGLYFLFVLAALFLGIIAGVVLFGLSIDPSEPVLDSLGYAGQFIVPWLLIAALYKVRLLRAVQGVIPYLIAAAVMMLLAAYLIRPYAYEAFAITTNAMAPTLLGSHLEAPRPRCGNPAYGTPLDPWVGLPAEGLMMNCSAERQPVYVTDVPPTALSADRILACKFVSPRRWDLITFRYPEDPTLTYVKRLVGLPNEELSIQEGVVWVDGKKLTPPESLQGIHYSPTIESNGRILSGPGSLPLKLGPDEYFVLGDFPEESADSRLWEKGAPGHPPYAVPESNITGVVINIYWPPTRWRAFR